MEGREGYGARLDSGEREGWGVRLPAAVAEDPAFAAWAGVRSVTVAVEENRLVVRPAARPGDRSAPGTPEAGDTKEIGRLRWFDEEKGYGFIELPPGEDRFFHRSGLSCDPEDLEPGLPVTFETRLGARGPVAVGVGPLRLPRSGSGSP